MKEIAPWELSASRENIETLLSQSFVGCPIFVKQVDAIALWFPQWDMKEQQGFITSYNSKRNKNELVVRHSNILHFAIIEIFNKNKMQIDDFIYLHTLFYTHENTSYDFKLHFFKNIKFENGNVLRLITHPYAIMNNMSVMFNNMAPYKKINWLHSVPMHAKKDGVDIEKMFSHIQQHYLRYRLHSFLEMLLEDPDLNWTAEDYKNKLSNDRIMFSLLFVLSYEKNGAGKQNPFFNYTNTEEVNHILDVSPQIFHSSIAEEYKNEKLKDKLLSKTVCANETITKRRI